MFDNPLIIFDCDGVLIDSEAIYLDEEFKFLGARNIHVDKAWYVREFMALANEKWRAKFSDLIAEHTGTHLSDAEYEGMKKSVRARIANEVQTIAGVEDMLGALKVSRCVASSTAMHFLPGKLERTGLADYFGDGVYSGDMVTDGKPAPDLFLHAASQMGGSADNAIVVEDSANGVKAGKSANMFTIGFTGGSHCFDGHDETLTAAGADLVLPSHKELTDWLRSNSNAVG
ncbi:MAG: HAD family phosphatase [Pseudomonadota bacterium]